MLDAFEVVDNTAPLRNASPKKSETPAPARGDYAVNREVDFFREEIVIETAPREAERILIEMCIRDRCASTP